jgi:ubiquinone/menaquinone biosynthesis C-methylase UbiE
MSVTSFYNALSPFYHLIYPDWDASVERQGAQLDQTIRELWGDRVKTILDATCGIGTQALGLARQGYSVTASDISAVPLERAKEEAAKRNLRIEFSIADLRRLSSIHRETFDVVIACDNSVPHLLSDDEIRTAFREMYRCAAVGCVISVRDYDPAESTGIKVVPYGVRTHGNRRFLVFQVWDFQGDLYDLSMYFVEDRGNTECTTHVMRSKYYAIPASRLLELMAEAGFSGVRRLDERFFQPLIVGFKRGEA